MYPTATSRTTGSPGRRLAWLVVCALVWPASLGVVWPASQAHAQPRTFEPTVEALIDPQAVAVGDAFQYTLRVQSNGQGEIKVLQTPNFGTLNVVGTSRGTEFRSGPQGVELVYKFTYTLQASTDGTFVIRGAQVRVAGKNIQGPDASVKVVPRGVRPPPGPEDRNGPAFLKVWTSQEDPYVGQQVQVEYSLMLNERQLGPFGIDVEEVVSPAFDGFWIEDISERTRPQPRREVIEGVAWSARPVQMLSVFPLREGEVEVEPMEMRATVSGFGALRGKRVSLTSGPVKLKVRPLPSGAPAGFHKGNVGQYTFDVSTDKQRVAVGEPLTVRLRVRGTGMIGRVELPQVPESDAWRLLEPVERKEVGVREGRVGGEKIAEVVLTPTAEGVLTVPSLTFHAFDPERGEYVSTSSSPLQVAVAGRKAEPPRKEVDLVERDGREPDSLRVARQPLMPLRPMDLLEGDQGEPGRAPLWLQPLFLLGLVGPPLGFGLWLGLGAWRQRKGDSPEVSRKGARKRSQGRLDEAAALAGRGDVARALEVTSEALIEALSSGLGVPPGGLSLARIERLLGERGVDAGLTQRVLALRRRCDEGRYAGLSPDDAAGVVEEARALVRELGGAL